MTELDKTLSKQAGVLLQNAEGEYLLQMRDGNPGIWEPLQWSFFGGGVEESEKPRDAAVREAEEEIGVVLDADKLTLAAETVIDGKYYVYLFTSSQTVEWKDVTLSEGAGMGFFTCDELRRMALIPVIRNVFTQHIC